MEFEPPSCMFFQKLIKFGAFQDKMNITKLSPIFQSKIDLHYPNADQFLLFYVSLNSSKEQCVMG